MSEYIGSRISLISKSDIKYVGTLHEINSDTHTVALESVTSYGTEGRKGNPAEEIAGTDQIYEYIVFRGSDVKELTIISPPGTQNEEKEPPKMPDDPAILGSARPPPNQPQQQGQPPPGNQNQFRGPPPPYPQQQQYGFQGPPPNQFPNQPPRFQGPGGPHGFPGTPGAVPGFGMGFGPPPPPPGYGMGYGPPPPPPHGFHGPPPPQFNQNQQMPMGPPGQQMSQQRPSPQQMQGQPQAAIGSTRGTPQPTPNHGQPPAPPPQQLPPQQKPVEMSATPGPPSDSSAGPPPPVESKPPVAAAVAPSAPAQAPQSQPKPAPRTNSRVAVPLPPPTGPKAAQKPVPPPAQDAKPQTIEDATQAATAAVAAAMAKLGTQDKAPVVAENAPRRPYGHRGGGRGRGLPRGGRFESAPRQIPKEDFDFESANKEFARQANGHIRPTENEDVTIPPVEGPKAADGTTEKGYNKASSFFDNISSDLKDRANIDRRQERAKNLETFGQGSVDGGGFRGRGRGRGFRRPTRY